MTHAVSTPDSDSEAPVTLSKKFTHSKKYPLLGWKFYTEMEVLASGDLHVRNRSRIQSQQDKQQTKIDLQKSGNDTIYLFRGQGGRPSAPWIRPSYQYNCGDALSTTGPYRSTRVVLTPGVIGLDHL